MSAGVLAGQSAVVTGGGRGIGRAITRRLAAQGAMVVVNYVADEVAAEEAVRLVVEAGGQARALRFDVGDAAAVRAAFDDIVDREGRLDILVNNAGVTIDQLLLRLKDDDWNRVLQTNLTGAFHCARAAVRTMIRARYGRIVNLTSVVAAMGNAGQVAYAAAKSGVVGLTRALAREVASRGITVNALAPGLVDTEMAAGVLDAQRAAYTALVPVGRVGTVDDVAAAAAFLCSPEAGYVTGQVLHVNGGLYM